MHTNSVTSDAKQPNRWIVIQKASLINRQKKANSRRGPLKGKQQQQQNNIPKHLKQTTHTQNTAQQNKTEREGNNKKYTYVSKADAAVKAKSEQLIESEHELLSLVISLTTSTLTNTNTAATDQQQPQKIASQPQQQ